MPYKKVNKECKNPRCNTGIEKIPKNQDYCTWDCFNEWRKYDKANYLNKLVEPFDVELQIEGDRILCANDLHIPYMCPDIFQKFLAIRDKFDVDTCVVGGDIFNADGVKSTKYGKTAFDYPLDQEIDDVERVFEVLLNEFDNIFCILGNHDERILRALDGGLRGDQLGKLALPSNLIHELGSSVHVSTQRYCTISSGDQEWRYTHPKNYSRNPPKVERELAQIHDCNVLSTHGHLFAIGFDRSGRHICAQIGAMVDQSRVPYCNLVDTTHPRWTKGFGLIREGYLYGFAEGLTDWSYWLGG